MRTYVLSSRIRLYGKILKFVTESLWFQLGCLPRQLDLERKMKFAKILGIPLSIIGLILYSPPLQKILVHIFGDAARIGAAIVFASGWALLLGYILFHLGMKTQKEESPEVEPHGLQ